MIGEQILNYKITSKIGEGGMGAVYLAMHTQIERKAAIKVLHPTYVNNPIIRERFKNEAATMARLKHPNIVDLYDYLEAPTGLYLIMEYVEGKPLDEYIAKISGPLSEEKAIHIFSKVLDGFEYAHRQGVVHRDIKPSNLIITPEFDVKILDFGIAKLLSNSKTQTKAGMKMGTVLYMSPEQVKGTDVDNRSDIYALGVTLFQLVTGKCPYDEEKVTEYEVYHSILNEPLPRAKTFYPKVSEKMQQIIDKATAKKPEHRFQTCQEFRQALLQLQSSNIPPQSPHFSTYNTNPSLSQTTFANIDSPLLEEASQRLPKTNPTLQQAVPPVQKAKPKQQYSSTIFLFVVLLLASAAFVLFNPLRLPKLQRYAYLDHKLRTPEQKKAEIQQKIQQFYSTMESHDFEKIRPLYAPVLENYFGNKNISIEDVEKASQTYWERYVAEKHDIDWNSLEYTQDEQGNHIATFDMKYSYRTKNSQWQTIAGKREIRMNIEWQVYYIINLNKNQK
ncbi:MAG: serine/threonine protein kinase [Microscillaceae bacterium]|nr:serine/threonine protein kinase [Microscillaceae bacterium]MDW8459954.1 serine/threonine-protein kinase [Cytophagales bacterium]